MKLASFRDSMILLAAAVATFGLSATAEARPIIPGAYGYGMETTAGKGGTVYRVTNLNASGSGSLKDCIDKSGARTCVFEVSGIIKITSDLLIRNSNIRIAGQTAPSPGIMLRGAALRIQASDVLVQHIRIRAGDDTTGPDPNNRDSIKIEGSSSKTVRNIVIDHCSVSWAIDENVSVWGPHDNITFTNNIFSEPLNESLHMSDDGRTREKHGFGVIVDAQNSHVTMIGNLFAHQVERNPLSRTANLIFVNNLLYNRAHSDIDLQSDDGRRVKSSIVGNVFLRGPSDERNTPPILVRTSGSYGIPSGSVVYSKGNYSFDVSNTLSEMIQVMGTTYSSLLQTSDAPIWHSGFTAKSTSNNNVYNSVLLYAGARPNDRDTVDKRVINHVKNRNGGVINCVSSNGSTRCNKNAGGWPSYAKNTRKLTLPSSHSSVASNGYTNLENWLNSMDRTVQGITSAESPTAPLTVSAN
jgi:pectate lyase